jgi:hypothetical protein
MPSKVRSRDVFVPSHPHVHIPTSCEALSSRHVLGTVEIAGEDRPWCKVGRRTGRRVREFWIVTTVSLKK